MKNKSTKASGYCSAKTIWKGMAIIPLTTSFWCPWVEVSIVDK